MSTTDKSSMDDMIDIKLKSGHTLTIKASKAQSMDFPSQNKLLDASDTTTKEIAKINHVSGPSSLAKLPFAHNNVFFLKDASAESSIFMTPTKKRKRKSEGATSSKRKRSVTFSPRNMNTVSYTYSPDDYDRTPCEAALRVPVCESCGSTLLLEEDQDDPGTYYCEDCWISWEAANNKKECVTNSDDVNSSKKTVDKDSSDKDTNNDGSISKLAKNIIETCTNISTSKVISKRCKKQKKKRSLPVFVCEDHDEMLPELYRLIARKRLPFDKICCVHVDSHPDMLLPLDLSPTVVFDKSALFDAISISSFLLPPVFAGHISTLYWLYPTGAQHFARRSFSPISPTYVGVGVARHLKKLRVNSTAPYFLNELLYEPQHNLDCTKKLLFVHSMLTTAISENNDMFPVTTMATNATSAVTTHITNLTTITSTTTTTLTTLTSVTTTITTITTITSTTSTTSTTTTSTTSTTSTKTYASTASSTSNISPKSSDDNVFDCNAVILDICLDFFSCQNPFRLQFERMYPEIPGGFSTLRRFYAQYDITDPPKSTHLEMVIEKRRWFLSVVQEMLRQRWYRQDTKQYLKNITGYSNCISKSSSLKVCSEPIHDNWTWDKNDKRFTKKKNGHTIKNNKKINGSTKMKTNGEKNAVGIAKMSTNSADINVKQKLSKEDDSLWLLFRKMLLELEQLTATKIPVNRLHLIGLMAELPHFPLNEDLLQDALKSFKAWLLSHFHTTKNNTKNSNSQNNSQKWKFPAAVFVARSGDDEYTPGGPKGIDALQSAVLAMIRDVFGNVKVHDVR